MEISIKQVDYDNEVEADELIFLLDEYAKDPMGGAEPLAEQTKQKLAGELAKLSYAFSYIAYVDGNPAGLINCFEGFSTFACAPVINVHDIVVLSQYRGLGLCSKLLESVEKNALKKGACKLTLEVLEGNKVAQIAYVKAGFEGYELDPEMGKAMFWQKKL